MTTKSTAKLLTLNFCAWFWCVPCSGRTCRNLESTEGPAIITAFAEQHQPCSLKTELQGPAAQKGDY